MRRRRVGGLPKHDRKNGGNSPPRPRRPLQPALHGCSDTRPGRFESRPAAARQTSGEKKSDVDAPGFDQRCGGNQTAPGARSCRATANARQNAAPPMGRTHQRRQSGPRPGRRRPRSRLGTAARLCVWHGSVDDAERESDPDRRGGGPAWRRRSGSTRRSTVTPLQGVVQPRRIGDSSRSGQGPEPPREAIRDADCTVALRVAQDHAWCDSSGNNSSNRRQHGRRQRQAAASAPSSSTTTLAAMLWSLRQRDGRSANRLSKETAPAVVTTIGASQFSAARRKLVLAGTPFLVGAGCGGGLPVRLPAWCSRNRVGGAQGVPEHKRPSVRRWTCRG